MADVIIAMEEYLNLITCVREFPTVCKRIKAIQDQLDAQRGMIYELRLKEKENGNK